MWPGYEATPVHVLRKNMVIFIAHRLCCLVRVYRLCSREAVLDLKPIHTVKYTSLYLFGLHQPHLTFYFMLSSY